MVQVSMTDIVFSNINDTTTNDGYNFLENLRYSTNTKSNFLRILRYISL